jgi:hypothetical protein
LAEQISKVSRRNKVKQRKQRKEAEKVNADECADLSFQFLVLNKTEHGIPMRTAKEIKTHILSKLPIIHSKAKEYLNQKELLIERKKLNPFDLPRRPFE